MRRIARRNLDERFIIRWWCKKYRLPPTDDRLAKYTQEELWIEFYEDLGESKPGALQKDGEIDVDETVVSNDPLVNEIERKLAAGEDVEELLNSFEGPATREYWRKKGDASLQKQEPADEFEDEYTPSQDQVKLT